MEQFSAIDQPKNKISFSLDGFSIREAELTDAATIWQAIDLHREYLKTWLPFVIQLKGVADEEAFLSSMLSEKHADRNIVCVIESDGQFCGLIGFVNTDHANHRTEIGYWLLPAYQGKGIMTRCVQLLCRWAIEKRGMHRIQIKCATGNAPSNAIPKRLGFTLEGTERDGELLASGKYTDIHIYSILKQETASW